MTNLRAIAELVQESLRHNHIVRGVARAEVLRLWAKVAGKDVASFTQAQHFRDGVLWVEVSDSETAMHLNYQRRHFVQIYQQRYHISGLRDIRFRVGTPLPVPVVSAPSNPIPMQTLDDDGKQALAALSQHLGGLALETELARATLDTATALVKRQRYAEQQGHPACLTCEVRTPPQQLADGLCFICQRHLDSPKVQRAAAQLSQVPDAALPLLSEDEYAVARHLAKQDLATQLHQLLPYVLADSHYRQPFSACAQRYLAHLLRKPLAQITPDDYAHLPPTMARVVGYWDAEA